MNENEWDEIDSFDLIDEAERMLERMGSLAISFPCLRDVPGVNPFDPMQLDEWATTKTRTKEELCTARFILAVWEGKTLGTQSSWKVSHFDFVEAMKTWDEGHRQAFLEWARAPWWWG